MLLITLNLMLLVQYQACPWLLFDYLLLMLLYHIRNAFCLPSPSIHVHCRLKASHSGLQLNLCYVCQLHSRPANFLITPQNSLLSSAVFLFPLHPLCFSNRPTVIGCMHYMTHRILILSPYVNQNISCTVSAFHSYILTLRL